MFAIITWRSYADVSVATNEDGSPILFLFRREAERYARENLSGHWQIVYLLDDE